MSNETKSLLINHYLKNNFNGYSRRFFVGTPAAEQQQEQQQQENQQQEHKDMPRYTLISRRVTHARTNETKRFLGWGFASELTPPTSDIYIYI